MGNANRFGPIVITGVVLAGAMFIARSNGISGHATGETDAAAGCGGDSSYSYPSLEDTEGANGGDGIQDVSGNTKQAESVADFATDFAVAACALYDECDELAGMGGGVDQCVRSVEDAYIEMDQDGDCDFDEGAAKSCLIELDDMECDELDDESSKDSACFQVCGEVPLWNIY